MGTYHEPEVLTSGMRLGFGGGYSQYRAAYGDVSGYRVWEGRAFLDWPAGNTESRLSVVGASAGRPGVDYLNALGLGLEVKGSIAEHAAVYAGLDVLAGFYGPPDQDVDDRYFRHFAGGGDLTARLGTTWASGRPSYPRLVLEGELSTTWLFRWQLAAAAGLGIPLGDVLVARPQVAGRCYARVRYDLSEGHGACSYGVQGMLSVRLRGPRG